MEKRLPGPNALMPVQPMPYPIPGGELIPMPEVVLSVVIYHPTRVGHIVFA